MIMDLTPGVIGALRHRLLWVSVDLRKITSGGSIQDESEAPDACDVQGLGNSLDYDEERHV